MQKKLLRYISKSLHFIFGNRLGLYTILLLALLAIYIDLPKTHLKFHLGPMNIDKTVQHPSIQLGKFHRDLEPKLGLDLQGGTHIVLEANMKDVPPDKREEALELSRNVIERRVNLFGVSEPLIQTSSNGQNYRIIVELAGVKDINEAIRLIGQTAKLEFREYITEPVATDSATFVLPTMENTKPTGLSGADLESAAVAFHPQTNEPLVTFNVAKDSQAKFGQVTASLVQRKMIIFLDDMYVSDPVVQQAISDSGQITGRFTLQEAKQLALQLNAGALKAPVQVVNQRNVGATLGNDAIRNSIMAGGVGLFVVAIFMILHYGSLGVIAVMALLIYTLLSLAIFKLIPVTLTLAGIAGFILSIGMAVDANILIFERMKEEIRWGKEKRQALLLGFDRAMSSVKASNISTLITTGILYAFGTSLVRGFALTLAIGVIISMFSAITVSKTLLKVLYRVS